MRHIRSGHVIGKLKRVIPIKVPVHGSRPKPASVIFSDVTVDFLGPAQKLGVLAIEISIVVEIVDIEFKAPVANLLNVAFRALRSASQAPPEWRLGNRTMRPDPSGWE